MCRAIREKLKTAGHRSENKPDTFSKSKSLNQLESRILEIQKWLGLDDETTQTWKELGVKCMKWTLHELDNGGVQLSDVQDLFPVIWKKFLDATGETDQFKMRLSNQSTADTSGACG